MLRPLLILLALLVPSAWALNHFSPDESQAGVSSQPYVIAHQEPAKAIQERHLVAAQITHGLLSSPQIAYSPQILTEESAGQVFDRFVDWLDPQRVFMTQEEVARLQPYRSAMKDAMSGTDLTPVVRMYEIWQPAAIARLNHAQDLLGEGFDFSLDESWEARTLESPFLATSQEVDGLWRKHVKNDWLRLRLAGQDDEAIRTTLSKRYARMASDIESADIDQVVAGFLNAYASLSDHHTNYMAPITAESFNINMSLSLEGIGAILQVQEDTVVVRSLIPGGPAARSGDIQVGDKILAVGQGEDGTMVDVVGWRLDEVVGLIRGRKGSQVRLQIASAAQSDIPRLVSLSRDKVMVEDQQARSSILEIEGQKVGVITLPGFYLDFGARSAGDQDAKSATSDVARLLGELEKEGVDAVLMDLRGNGGGSLDEAVALTGLFIDVGPVVQIKGKQGGEEQITVQGDTVPGVAWDGPLAVLVNSESASASEIFAGAIQDYGRGLVIGETTFGKGTVQVLVDLARATGQEGVALGQLKLTIAEFFRISGQSNQRDGVVPDLYFPQTPNGDKTGEGELENALAPSTIAPARYEKIQDLGPVVEKVRPAHEARMQSDPQLQWWMEDVERFRTERDRTKVSLNEQVRRTERAENHARMEQRDAQRRRLGLFVPSYRADDGLAYNERSIQEQVQAEEEAKQMAQNDPLLREAAHVLADTVILGGL